MKPEETLAEKAQGCRHQPHLSEAQCRNHLAGVRDAIYVVSGKWKLPLIIALSAGPQRFSDLERTVAGITPKLLSKELKELEMNGFLTRHVYPTVPVRVEYELAPYADTLHPVIEALADWGHKHRRHVMGKAQELV